MLSTNIMKTAFYRYENKGDRLTHKQDAGLQWIQTSREQFFLLAKVHSLQTWKQRRQGVWWDWLCLAKEAIIRFVRDEPDHDFSTDEHSWLFF